MDNSETTSTDTPKIAETSSVSVPEKSKKWLKIGLLGVAGLIVAGGLVFAGYKLGHRQTEVLQPGPTSIPTVTFTPTPMPQISPTTVVTPPPDLTHTPDPTADWKTYTNTKYEYSIKYPPEVQVQEGQGYEERIQETIFTFFGPKYQGPGEWTDGFGITLAVIKNPNQNTPTQFAQEYYKQAQEDIKNKILEGDISKCKVESVVRSNTNGARFTYCTQAPGSGVLNFSEWFVKNELTIQIYAVLQNESYRLTFDQTLSTFKFLD